jgi:integrase
MSIRRIERDKGVVWVVEAYAPRRSRTCYSEDEALDLAAKWRLHPIAVSPGRTTLGQYLTEWLDTADVAPSTRHGYRNIVTNHLIPRLGSVRLAQVSSHHWRQYRAKARKLDGSELSPTSLLQHYRVLHKALNDAVHDGLLPIHPFENVRAPRLERHEARFFTKEEVATLVSKSAEVPLLHMPVLLAAGLGLRRSETLALKWSDVDLEKGTVCIRHALDYRKGRAVTKELKGRKVLRLRLTKGLVAALKAHRKRQAAMKLKQADVWVENGLVCCYDDGTPIHPDRITHWFAKLVKAQKMSGSFHSLRHSHATHLLAGGVPVTYVQKRLGHSTITTTVGAYSHVISSAEDEVADAVERVLGI